jgi:caffeoyl-CoA O-methyltransferase
MEEYSSAGTAGEAELLALLERETNLRAIQPKMVSGQLQGTFLQLITGIVRPRLVLEIGTFTGYSALSIAAGMEETTDNLQPQLHTIEIDDELEERARSFFERSPHGAKIHLHIGPALEIVPRLAKSVGRAFDMVFIDGDKREYPDYYRMLMGDGDGGSDGGSGDSHSGGKETSSPMVRSGGVILADNVLWYGKVAEPEAVKQADRMSQGIIEFNRMVAADPRVENVILPLRDGINMIRVK